LNAYIYGIPLLETNKTFLNMTSNDHGEYEASMVNQFYHVRELNNSTSKAVVAPGASGLSSIAWLDLSDEPQVLHVPEVKEHYFVLALLDPYTEDLCNLGSANDTPEGDYVICGPDQHGIKVPSGTTKISVDYTRIWIIGSTQLKGPGDVTTVNKIQDGYTITPLSKYGTDYQPPTLSKPDSTTNGYNIPEGMEFFDTLGQLLQQFPPPAADKSILKTLTSVGIGPGKTPSKDLSLNAETIRGLTDALVAGPKKMKTITERVYRDSAKIHNGYFLGGFGSYGTDYQLRAVVAMMGLGAFTSDQTIFALTFTDQNLEGLNGSNRYVMHMSETPPGREGWSITVYDSKGALIQNSISRSQFNNLSELTKNADGSVDILFQSGKPQVDLDVRNWLPIPEGQGFQVIFRLMAPQKDCINEILEGNGWQPPALNLEQENE
jgi:hypothetical protein